jgi:hypothetical protein
MTAKYICLTNQAAREAVEFIPAGDTVTIVKMWMSLTGCFSPHTSSTIRTTLSLTAARSVYRRLLSAGYKPR